MCRTHSEVSKVQLRVCLCVECGSSNSPSSQSSLCLSVTELEVEEVVQAVSREGTQWE
jgi:hypothetical protein